MRAVARGRELEVQRILITGAAGELGRDLRGSLRRPGRELVLLDVAAQAPPEADEQARVVTASITDLEAMCEAAQDADAIVHLASLVEGHSWQEYLDVNVNGTYTVLEAARRAGVGRVIYASSHHAVGFAPKLDGAFARDNMFPRPDSYYGVCKVASEALGSLYHDRHGLDVVCIRIGSYRQRPNDRRCLWNWLSPADMNRMVEAALTVENPGFRVVWGISNNDRRWMSLDEGVLIGYHPQDNAEDLAEEILATTDPDDPGAAYDHFLGGAYCAPDFDESARS
jgi:nucleoside-diphosphate-sugar epimerase